MGEGGERGEDGFALVVAGAVFLDHGEDEVGAVLAEDVLEVVLVAGAGDGFAGEGGGVAELLFEVGAVGDDDDLEALEVRQGAKLADEKDHGEALAGPLGVPDDAAALVHLAVLVAGLAGAEAADGLLDGAVLL